MKPTFYKTNILDLGPFATLTDAFLKKIPRDGSTVDLQPQLFTLVGTPLLVSAKGGADVSVVPRCGDVFPLRSVDGGTLW